jgi:hypothetical protein
MKNQRILALLLVLAAILSLSLAGCKPNPNDPKNYAYDDAAVAKLGEKVDEAVDLALDGALNNLFGKTENTPPPTGNGEDPGETAPEVSGSLEIPEAIKDLVKQVSESVKTAIVAALKEAKITTTELDKLLALNINPDDLDINAIYSGEPTPELIAAFLDEINELEATGVSYTKIADFIYALYEGSESIVAEFYDGLSEEDLEGLPTKEEILEEYNKPKTVATKAEFEKIFVAYMTIYKSGIVGVNNVLSDKGYKTEWTAYYEYYDYITWNYVRVDIDIDDPNVTWEYETSTYGRGTYVVPDLASGVDQTYTAYKNLSPSYTPTAAEFRTMVRANIAELKSSLLVLTSTNIDAFSSVTKKYITVYGDFEAAALAEAITQIDEYTAALKKLVEPAKAALNVIDDAMIAMFYKQIDETSESTQDQIDITLAGAKLLNAAIERGLDKDTIKLVLTNLLPVDGTEGELADELVDLIIKDIAKYKNVPYGTAYEDLPESDLLEFVLGN